ncbi:hypothetical protein MOSE0_D02806 [Monosporozyma servazzii]
MTSSIDNYPPNLVELIKTSKFVHLATCSNDLTPSLALMNYLYIPKDLSYFHDDDYIIFATEEDTVKYDNILGNPNISLLFHDWISVNNSMINKQIITNSNNDTQTNLNHIVNRYPIVNIHDQMSATIKGEAEILSAQTKESNYYKKLLLKGNPEGEVFILGNTTTVVKVKMLSCKVVDINNNIKTF